MTDAEQKLRDIAAKYGVNCLRQTRRNINADGTPWGADRLLDVDGVNRG